jgi:hypothetical protein
MNNRGGQTMTTKTTYRFFEVDYYSGRRVYCWARGKDQGLVRWERGEWIATGAAPAGSGDTRDEAVLDLLGRRKEDRP